MTQDRQTGSDDRRDLHMDIPLAVSLDAVVRTNLDIESLFAALGAHPFGALAACGALARGRAGIRARLADLAELDPATLPYDESVLGVIAQARRDGRRVYLVASVDHRLAQAIARHLDLAAETAADRFTEELGAGGFDYIGATRADLAALERARTAFIVGGRADLARALPARATPPTVLPRRPQSLARVFDAIRPEQWFKNLLVFVPIVTALQFNAASVIAAAELFLAFSLCASAGYVFNDLVDLKADRQHPEKRHRPFAAMEVPLAAGLGMIPLLLAAAFAIALVLSAEIAAILLVYLVATAGYSLLLKRKLLIDVITLGALYTLRVYAGAVAIGVPLSGWLLLFCIFIFTALALVKRCSEMTLRFGSGLRDPTNRDYKASDLPALLSLAAAAAFSAVVIFALYAQSEAVLAIYSRPQNLLFAVPILVYWLGRMIVIAHRGLLVVDPVVFAIRDRVSWLCAILTAAIIVSAI